MSERRRTSRNLPESVCCCGAFLCCLGRRFFSTFFRNSFPWQMFMVCTVFVNFHDVVYCLNEKLAQINTFISRIRGKESFKAPQMMGWEYFLFYGAKSSLKERGIRQAPCFPGMWGGFGMTSPIACGLFMVVYCRCNVGKSGVFYGTRCAEYCEVISLCPPNCRNSFVYR